MLLNGADLKTEGSVKLLDFGIAKVITSELGEVEALTRTGEIFGSPLYMSPEQCSGGIVDHRSDIYSLGCVLFEALTGTLPLIGSNPLRTMMMHMNDAPPTMREAALGVEYSQVLKRIVSKMLAKNPSDRQSNLAAVALEIAHACGGDSAPVHADSNLMNVESVKSQAPGRSLKFTLPQLTLILFATIFASSFCTYMVASVMWAQSVSKEEAVTFKPLPKPGEKPKDGPFGESAIAVNGGVDKEAAEVKSAYERAKPIECKTVMLRGVREKCIEFPERSIGEVRYLPMPVTFDSKWIFLDASKKKFFPTNVELTYKVSDAENAFLLPNYFIFEKIAPDIFAGVAIERSDGITVRDYLSGDEKADAVENVKADLGILSLLKVISKWTVFRDLELKNIALTEARLEALNGLHQLKNLTLVNSKFDSKVFARQPFVGWLKSLYSSEGDLSEILKTIAKSTKISYVDMGLNCTAMPDAIRTLKNSRTLKYFVCRNKVTNEQVFALTSLTNLQLVAFDRPLTAEQANYFAENGNVFLSIFFR